MKKAGKYILLTERELEDIRKEVEKETEKRVKQEINEYMEEYIKELKEKHEDEIHELLEDFELDKYAYEKKLGKCNKKIEILKKIIKDKKMAYLKQLARSVDQGRLKREIKKANRELISLELVLEDIDNAVILDSD